MDAWPDGSLRRRFLAFASHPESRSEDFLCGVLSHAMERARSFRDGAFYLSDGGEPLLRAQAGAGIPKAWGPELPAPVSEALRPARPLKLDASELPGVGVSLWIPLVEGRRQIVGVLGLISRQKGPVPDRLLSCLEALAADALPAVNRLLLREALAGLGMGQAVVGTGEAMQDLERRIKQAGRFGEGAVLITGERGSGKEMTAMAVHAWSVRRERPFVPVLAAALSEGLLADELFGHEKHSFTGAMASRPGRFGAADTGSLFLDEVGDLPPAVQSSLMRIIDKGELPRIGRDLPLRVDVRVIAATNRDLRTAMAQGSFRRDLYDRLSVFEIRVPPLRERREDIPLLAELFLQRHCHRLGRRRWFAGEGVCGSCGALCHTGCASRDFMEALQSYSWPGNVRELENVVASLVACAPDDVLESRHLPRHILEGAEAPHHAAEETGTADFSLDVALRRHIVRVLELAGNNQTRAARLLGIPLSTMRNKMKRLGLPLPKAPA